MKCWCFNQEQLDAALAAWVEQRSAVADFEVGPHAVRAFLTSAQAREHKLTIHGVWDRQDPPVEGSKA